MRYLHKNSGQVQPIYNTFYQSDAEVERPKKISLRQLVSASANNVDAEINNRIHEGGEHQMDAQKTEETAEDIVRDILLFPVQV